MWGNEPNPSGSCLRELALVSTESYFSYSFEILTAPCTVQFRFFRPGTANTLPDFEHHYQIDVVNDDPPPLCENGELNTGSGPCGCIHLTHPRFDG
jgi:hypothetical protein